MASPTQHVTASQKQRAPGPAQVPEEGTQMAIPRCDLTMGHPSTTQEHPMPLAPMHVALHPRSGAHPQIKAVVPRLPLGAQIDFLDGCHSLMPSSDRSFPRLQLLGGGVAISDPPPKGNIMGPLLERRRKSLFVQPQHKHREGTNLKGRGRYSLEKRTYLHHHWPQQEMACRQHLEHHLPGVPSWSLPPLRPQSHLLAALGTHFARLLSVVTAS